MAAEPPDATREEIANEESLRRWEAEVSFRQSNVLPLDAALNEGRFYGLLVKGDLCLNWWQRLGAIFLGLPWAIYGIGIAFYDLLLLVILVRNPEARVSWMSMAYFPGAIFVAYIGYRICRTAITARRTTVG